MNYPKIGIVVPTLGTRPEYLAQSLRSIRGAGLALIHIVMPNSAELPAEITSDLYDQVIEDLGNGLASAIHTGLNSFPEAVQFISWLGDDDLLEPGSLNISSMALQRDPRAVLVFGGCHYIDADNRLIFTNKSGRYAVPLMRVGPQLIPQPGSLFRRDTYREIGGLNSQFKWAFDLDLLIRMSKVGSLKFLDATLASFRWHEGSLSVGGRDGSVREASLIRKTFLPRWLRPAAELWEVPIRFAIRYAGSKVSNRRASPLT
jgi:GT2 family glycosyltransferase